jgi:pimeloyl-ACP methyl ester carboxylesterase
MSDPRRFEIALPDGQVSCLGFGDASRPVDVIFLHATGFNARTYVEGLTMLGRRLRVIAPDQRGHGLSSLPSDPERLQSWLPFADDLKTMVAALNLSKPVVLAGHSMGGTVSLMAAPELGEQVKALVLFDPVLMRQPGAPMPDLRETPLAVGARRRRRQYDSKAAALEAYVGRGAFKSWPAAAVAGYVEDAFAPSPGGGVELTCAPEWEAAIFCSQDHDPWAPFHRLAIPIHVLRAEHGSTSLAAPMRIEVEGHPERVLETVPSSSHFLPIERPDLVAQAISEAVG